MAIGIEIDLRRRIRAGIIEVISGVILAAGASSRMGRPKATLVYRGETFLARMVRLFRAKCDEVLVVLRAETAVEGARVVVNPDPERGMLSSLKCAFQALNPATQAAAFTPVDFPGIEAATLDSVIGGWRGELLRIPRCGGLRGHPVLVAAALIPEFLALPDSAEAREVIHRHESDIVYAEVNDSGILTDVDTPADYERLR